MRTEEQVNPWNQQAQTTLEESSRGGKTRERERPEHVYLLLERSEETGRGCSGQGKDRQGWEASAAAVTAGEPGS